MAGHDGWPERQVAARWQGGGLLAFLSAILFPGWPTVADQSRSGFRNAVAFQEDFENGNTNGWDSSGAGGPGLEGLWEIGDPSGTMDGPQQAQPEDAYGGAGCAFTGQNVSFSQGDVDEGVVYLVSPPIDLNGFNSAQLSYVRWFYNRDLGEDPEDFFRVQVRESEVAPWVDLEVLDTNQSANSWIPRNFFIETFIALTSTVELRFVASDGAFPNPGNIIEAAVDDVTITVAAECFDNGDCAPGEYCDGAHTCVPYGDGDFDFDGDVDVADFTAFQQCFGSVGTGPCAPGNLVGDETVGSDDYVAFVGVLAGPQ